MKKLFLLFTIFTLSNAHGMIRNNPNFIAGCAEILFNAHLSSDEFETLKKKFNQKINALSRTSSRTHSQRNRPTPYPQHRIRNSNARRDLFGNGRSANSTNQRDIDNFNHVCNLFRMIDGPSTDIKYQKYSKILNGFYDATLWYNDFLKALSPTLEFIMIEKIKNNDFEETGNEELDTLLNTLKDKNEYRDSFMPCLNKIIELNEFNETQPLLKEHLR